MIKAEGANHVEFSNPNQVLNKERLVVCGPGLIERDDVRGRTAWREQKIRVTRRFG